MMKRGLLLALTLLLAPAVVAATTAEWVGTLTISNAGATSKWGMVAFTLDTDTLVDNGYMEADYSDVCLVDSSGNQYAFMPALSGDDTWVAMSPTVAASGTQNMRLYTGGGVALGGMPRLMLTTAGMTRADIAALELGNNFAIEQKGYVDTSYAASKQLVYKSGAFQTYVPSEGVVASVFGTPTTVRPTGNSDPGADWTSEASAYDNNTTTSSYTSERPSDYLILTRAATATDSIDMYLDSTSASPGIEVGYYDGSNWHTIYDDVFTDGAGWYAFDLGGYDVVSQVRIRRTNTTAGSTLYVHEVKWDAVDAAVHASVATGSHTIRTEADGTNLELWVDGVLADAMALGGASVTDNANNWSFLTNGVMPYMEYHKIWVGGALKQHIEWTGDATWDEDQSGNGNDVTATLLATDSDADISAVLGPFEPISPASASYTPAADIPEFEDTAPSMPARMYGELDTSNLPGADVINDLLAIGGVPQALFWFPVIFYVAMFAGLGVFAATQSLFGQGLGTGGVLALFVFTGAIPFWILMPFAFVVLSTALNEKVIAL